MPLPCFSQKFGGSCCTPLDEQVGILDGLVARVVLGLHADDRRLDPQIDVLGHQRDPGGREFLLQRQGVGENGVVRPMAGQAVRQHRFELLRLKEQPAGGRALAVVDRHRGRQREPRSICFLVASLHQLVEEAADLAHVAGRFGQALLAGVELLEHGHRDVDVVLFEAEDRGRIVHEHVRVEHENAPLAAAAGAPWQRRPAAAAGCRSQCLHRRQYRLGMAVHLDLAPRLRAARPCASIRKVLRSMPRYFLPYMLFSWITS